MIFSKTRLIFKSGGCLFYFEYVLYITTDKKLPPVTAQWEDTARLQQQLTHLAFIALSIVS